MLPKIPLQLIAKLALCAALFFAGWSVNGWRKDVEIERIRAEVVQRDLTAATKALDNLKSASDAMAAAAKDIQKTKRLNDAKLDQLTKEIKKFKPLPPDCRPDSDRVRNLESAIDTANRAISRQ